MGNISQAKNPGQNKNQNQVHSVNKVGPQQAWVWQASTAFL